MNIYSTIKKKFTIFILVFTMILGLVPTLSVQAATTDFKIISKTEVTAAQAKKWAQSKGATDTFADLAKLYWKYAEECGGVNPGIAYVQAAKETGYGRFGGVLDESYNNPCGMKTSSGGGDYDKEAHQRFNSWDEGVQAHMDHLALYAGADGYPKANTYDPRHFVTIKGKATTTNSLGGKWAPSQTYGEEIGKLYMSLMDSAGVTFEKDEDEDLWEDVEDEEDTSAAPNPGTVEKKPADLSIEEAIKLPEKITNDTSGTDSSQGSGNDSPNITSTIGWKNVDGNWYYYKSDETKAFGWIKPDSNWYYLDDADGKMVKGWLKNNNKWYYLDESGAMITGWKLIDSKWYLFDKNGIMTTGVQNDGNSSYYLDKSGALIEEQGWKKVEDKWIYLEKGGKIKLGWLKENNAWYYLQGDGSMVNGLKRIDGQVYSFYDNGTMQTGWKSVNSNWYYFKSSGEMATGWTYDGDTCYYLYDNGAMAKGWITIGDSWYLLSSSGVMQTGWVTSNGDTYYLDKSTGRMVTNTTVDGYKIGKDGKRKGKVNQGDSNSNNSNSNNSNSNNSQTGPGSTGKVIYVDAGHDYGKDSGALSEINGVKYSETDLNMQVADKLKTSLENRGYTVIMTRNLGERPSFSSLTESLSYRVNKANNANADLFISIHHNSAGETAKGIETLYSEVSQDDAFGGQYDSTRIAKSKSLAFEINNNIASSLDLTNRGGKSQNLYVCRNTKMPAVLVEVGFITNAEEAVRCSDPSSQQRVAEAIAAVVSKHY